MRPVPNRVVSVHMLQLGRKLDFITVRAEDHKKQIIAGAMTPRTPSDRDIQGR